VNSRFGDNSRQSTEETSSLWKWIVGIGVVVAIIVAALWFILGFGVDTGHIFVSGLVNGIWKSWFFPHGWNIFLATPFFWWCVVVVVGFGLFLLFNDEDRKTFMPRWLTVTLSALLAGALVLTIGGSWNLSKSGAQAFNNASTFVVHDPSAPPSSLGLVDASGSAMVGIEKGELPSSWVPRVASATGAVNVMKRTGDAIANTELMDNTITYIYGSGNTGVWTAIRNGIHQQSVYGVTQWTGAGENVTTCRFTGKNSINHAFGASWGKNLWDDVVAKDIGFTFDKANAWGYCDGDTPVIVIPGTKTVGFGLRTVDQADGVMKITGSPSGDPVIQHFENVKPGDFPGPVYPERLVDQQRDSLSWAAGRCFGWFQQCFGLDVTDVASQSGNSTDFLLKDENDGRLYWVTPMKPRSTDSQTLVAYSVTPADSNVTGELNRQKVYVMNDNDPRIVNLDNLNAVVMDKVRSSDPGFFTGDPAGRIVEFLPISDTQWQVFAEVNGRVKYRIDVNIGAKVITSTLVYVDDSSPAPTSTSPSTEGSGAASCDTPAKLSDKQLADCFGKLTTELQQRQAGAAKK
jgi:hypothetical protein